jgi:hypothetical protein
MQCYTVLQPITLYSGILDLTSSQAVPRLSSLIPLGEGLYEIAGPVQFKAGEIIGYDGEVNKALIESLDTGIEAAADEAAADEAAADEAAADEAAADEAAADEAVADEAAVSTSGKKAGKK